MANTIVFLNSPFRSHEREQACSRCDRLGQTEVVQIFDVYLDTGKEPNISTRSQDIMQWSKDQVDAMLGTGGSAALEGLDDIDVEGMEDFLPEDTLPELTQIAQEGYSW